MFRKYKLETITPTLIVYTNTWILTTDNKIVIVIGQYCNIYIYIGIYV